jgi:hypothetical protein
MVYCLTRDGKQLWRRQVSGLIVYSGTLLDDAGNAFLLSLTLSGSMVTSSTLYKLNSDGSIAWSRATNESSLTAPFYNFDFDVCVVDRAGELYAFDDDGNLQHNFMLPFPPASALLDTSVASFETLLVFGDSGNNIRIHVYNDSFTTAISLGEQPITSPTVNTQSHIVVGTLSTGPDPALLLNYYDAGTELWDIQIGGEYMSNLCVGQSDRIYFSSFFVDESAPVNFNGVSCVLPDQTTAWFYPTEEERAAAPVIADENLLVFATGTLFGSSGGHKNSSIIGIRGN